MSYQSTNTWTRVVVINEIVTRVIVIIVLLSYEDLVLGALGRDPNLIERGHDRHSLLTQQGQGSTTNLLTKQTIYIFKKRELEYLLFKICIVTLGTNH